MNTSPPAPAVFPVCSEEEGGCLLRRLGIENTTGQASSLAALDKNFKVVFLSVVASVLLILGGISFFLFYPFKTCIFTQPIEITNQRPSQEAQPQVSMFGELDMTIYYEKFVDNDALVVRTVVRKFPDGTMAVLDSNTAVSTRKAGKGVTYSHYQLLGGDSLPGKDTYIIFSLYYTLFGFRPIMVQYETEPFEITKGVAK